MCTEANQNATTLLFVEEDDEVRRITMSYGEREGLALVERTDGKVTLLAFGTLTHRCKIVVAPANVAAVAHAVGAEAGQPADAKRVGEALQRFFCTDEAYLADLQDVLDVRGIPYACTIWNGDEVAYRSSAAPVVARPEAADIPTEVAGDASATESLSAGEVPGASACVSRGAAVTPAATADAAAAGAALACAPTAPPCMPPASTDGVSARMPPEATAPSAATVAVASACDASNARVGMALVVPRAATGAVPLAGYRANCMPA